MRVSNAVFLIALTITATASSAAESVIEVSGHRCHAASWNVPLKTYAGGALRSCYLAGTQLIDEIPCDGFDRGREIAARERGGTSATLFYPDGGLRQCLAARSGTRGGQSFEHGEVVRLSRDGTIASPLSGPFAIVYPTLVRSMEGTAIDLESRDRIAAAMREQLRVEVRTSDRTLVFKMPDGSQWDILQAGIDSFADQFLESAPDPAFYHVVFEYLVGQTRGGEAIGGIEIYVIEPTGFGDRSTVINSHYPGFNLLSRSPRKRAEVLDRTTRFLIRDLKEGFRTELSSYHALRKAAQE